MKRILIAILLSLAVNVAARFAVSSLPAYVFWPGYVVGWLLPEGTSSTFVDSPRLRALQFAGNVAFWVLPIWAVSVSFALVRRPREPVVPPN